MKNLKFLLKIFIIVILFVVYIYVIAINAIPENIVIFQGEDVNIKTILGLNVNVVDEENALETSSTNQNGINNSNKQTAKLNLFQNIFLKNIDIDVLPKTKVIPIGSVAGIKLYTNGVLVVGMSEIQGIDNKKYKPYESSGIQEGDRIIAVNNTDIENTEDLMKNVNMSNGNEVKIKYVHNQKSLECSIKPVETSGKEYKLGLWVRDSAAGVGTVTFYEPSSQSFGALGHGITDIDTEQLIDIASGEFVTTKILNVKVEIRGEYKEQWIIKKILEKYIRIQNLEYMVKLIIFQH